MISGNNQNTTYDYIITGAGCAGLSLLLHMQQHPFFTNKKILLLDADDKKKNDRTWCFWETSAGLFQPVVCKEWSQTDFYGQSFSARFDIAPYKYKMIRGNDLYRFVFDKIASWQNIEFRQEKAERVYSEGGRGYVQTPFGTYEAQYVFNSILFQPHLLQKKGSLLQHFKGWMITTKEEAFNTDVATFMDFRLRPAAENTFVYVLPLNNRKALVEYTVFSPALLSDEVYTSGLKDYISRYLKIDDYTIEEEEFGIIPMSTYTFPISEQAIINIGTAGGQTKSSSGYTFQFIQKHSAAIIDALLRGEHPAGKRRVFDKRFNVYDRTMLQVLYSGRLTASEIFSDLFRRNKPQLIFKFLDNETSMGEEVKIMNSMPSHIFLPAALKGLFGNV